MPSFLFLLTLRRFCGKVLLLLIDEGRHTVSIQNTYKNKLFSILGDSISTLAGYSLPDGAAFYDSLKKLEANVFFPKDTWWGQVIDRLGGSLLINNSISGSTVCWHHLYEVPSYGCSDERTSSLDAEGRTPDVIMVYLGTNDWGRAMRPTPRNQREAEDLTVFSVAYEKMLKSLKSHYPSAEIWCFTLAVSAFKRVEDFAFPYCHGGRHIEEYCEVIRACARAHGCRLIDLYENAQPYDTVDGFHPNADGMRTLADATVELVQRKRTQCTGERLSST